jgi:phosphoglycolate phosphatase-like HAD superfamily hydrolase
LQYVVGIFEKKVHVGDTPFDVLAARDAGFMPIGVTTGIFSGAELSQHVSEAYIISNIEQVVDKL